MGLRTIVQRFFRKPTRMPQISGLTPKGKEFSDLLRDEELFQRVKARQKDSDTLDDLLAIAREEKLLRK
jgi:hypothetical protein